MIMRPCQQEAVDEVYEHLRTKDTTPCVVLPTGTGKSLCLARIASDAVTLWGGRVLILAHVKELLEQNAEKVRRLCPEGNNLGRIWGGGGLPGFVSGAGAPSATPGKPPLCCSPCLSIFMYSAHLGVASIVSNILLKYVSVYSRISNIF